MINNKRENKNSVNGSSSTATSFPAAPPAYCFFAIFSFFLSIPFRFIYRKKLRLDSLNKNSLAFGIFVLSADFSVSPLLCRVSFYLLNLTVSFVREYQQQRAVHFALPMSPSLKKALSHNRFTQFFFARFARFCYHSRLLRCAVALSASLSLACSRIFICVRFLCVFAVVRR